MPGSRRSACRSAGSMPRAARALSPSPDPRRARRSLLRPNTRSTLPAWSRRWPAPPAPTARRCDWAHWCRACCVKVRARRRAAGRCDLLADHVVLATGAWAAACGDWLGAPLPGRPVKGQMVAVSGPSARHSRPSRSPRYSGSWEVGRPSRRGGSRGVRSHSLRPRGLPRTEGRRYGLRRRHGRAGRLRSTRYGRWGQHLLASCAGWRPRWPTAPLSRAWAGLRPGTPDHLPTTRCGARAAGREAGDRPLP